MEGTAQGSMFLGIVLKIIIVVLFFLSALLLYSLLLVSIEQRSFEFGVLRLIGLKKTNIIYLILI